jgi:DNA primase small subunit
MSSIPITKAVMSEYYQRVYPVDLIARWLRYGDSGSTLGRREFCFTLVGDIFTRFRSYPTEAALKADLVRDGPEKIDIGAVYNMSPDKKNVVQLITEQRELVFDIDMSDYDTLRSCCKGKQVCANCWTWMSTAALILRDIMTNDFGFRHIVPVFSGRRGIHMWILDDAARRLTDEERSAIVGYCTVIGEKGAINIVQELKQEKLHPTLIRVHDRIIAPRFTTLFLTSERVTSDGTYEPNANCIFESAAAAQIIFDILLSVESLIVKATDRKVGTTITLEEDGRFHPDVWARCEKRLPATVLAGVRFSAMYPRLDEKVSTRRDHLLKLPFCVHPGTGRLCVPLTFDTIDDFNPQVHPPTLEELLNVTGAIPHQWMKPFTDVLEELERERVKSEPAVKVDVVKQED